MIDFNKVIENYVKRKTKEKKIGRYYASEIGSCLRRIWLSYKKPKAIDIDVLKVFESGKIFHDFVARVIKSEKNKEMILINHEKPIEIQTENFVVAGRIDDVIIVKIGNEKKDILIEIKTTKSIPNKHRLEHEMQLQIYMKALGIHNGIIVYIQKDDIKTATFPIKYNEALFNYTMQRFQKLHKYLIQHICPEAEGKINNAWACEKCAWKKECDEIDKLK